MLPGSRSCWMLPIEAIDFRTAKNPPVGRGSGACGSVHNPVKKPTAAARAAHKPGDRRGRGDQEQKADHKKYQSKGNWRQHANYTYEAECTADKAA